MISGNTILNDSGPRSLWNATTTTTAQITNNIFYGLTAGQIASGPNIQSGNQFLVTEPALDTTHPWRRHITSRSRLIDIPALGDRQVTQNPAIKGTGRPHAW